MFFVVYRDGASVLWKAGSFLKALLNVLVDLKKVLSCVGLGFAGRLYSAAVFFSLALVGCVV